MKSDIYALGLILFEIFTGRRAYDAKTLGDLKQLHDTGTVPTPSSIVKDLDPAVERVILRCLEKDPERRPASALTVAASLPGGDPLAAALAAGETPSPDMLAAAGETEALGVAWGVAAVAAVVVGSAGVRGIVRAHVDRRPGAVRQGTRRPDRSRGADDGIARLSRRPGGQASGFSTAGDYTGWLWRTRSGPTRWDSISIGNPPAVLFWYRTSPREMVPIVPPRVRPGDPPLIQTDMRLLTLDVRGRLREFRSVPPQVDATDAPAEEPRWIDCSRRPACHVRLLGRSRRPGCLAITPTHERPGKVRFRNSLTSGYASRPQDIAGNRCGSHRRTMDPTDPDAATAE